MTAVHSDLQSVFDKVWQEFVVDGRAQGLGSDGCCYRGDGRDPTSDVRCVIGVCIPDSMYDPTIENNTIGGISRNKPAFYKSVFNGIDPMKLGVLQNIHDVEDRFKHMETELIEYAEHYNLRCPPQGEIKQ